MPLYKLAKTKVSMRTILAVLGRLLRIRRVSANRRSVEEMERQVGLLRDKIRYLQVMASGQGSRPKTWSNCAGSNGRRGPTSNRELQRSHY